jgi:hypothetical protein
MEGGTILFLPVLNHKTGHALELSRVVRDHHGSQVQRLSGQHHIVGPDRLGVGFEIGEMRVDSSRMESGFLVEGRGGRKGNPQLLEPFPEGFYFRAFSAPYSNSLGTTAENWQSASRAMT